MSIRPIVLRIALGLAPASASFGQVLLSRTSVPGGSTCGSGSAGVEMRTTDMRLVFDTCFGGTPRWWYLHGLPDGEANSIISPHPGEAMSAVFDTGQDATQGGCNGITANPIARLDGGNSQFTYYAHELEFTPPGGQNANAVYALRGFFPFFWLSHAAIDDSIPPRTDGTAQNGWATCYSRCVPTDECSCSGREYRGFGTPIWFDATAADPSGIILVGNARKPIGPIAPCNDSYKWHERVLEIQEGRFACKIRVHMDQASSAGIAGILFRKRVPTGSNPTIDDAFRRAGYHLYVNKQGVIQVARSDGTGSHPIVWNAAGAVFAPGVASAGGALIELRTHNGIPDLVEIIVDNVKVGQLPSEADPILGEMFGLYATDSPGNSIQFSDRQVFDVGVEMVIKYTAKPDGTIESDVKAQTVQPFVTTTRLFYTNHMPGAFLNSPGYSPQPNLRRAEAFDQCGDYATEFICNTGCGELCSESCNVEYRCDPSNLNEVPEICPHNPRTNSCPGGLLSPILRGGNDVRTLWVGDNAKVHGLWMTPVLARLDGNASTVAHSLTQVFPTLPRRRAISHISPQGFSDQDPLCVSDCGPQNLSSLRMVTAWSATQPPPLPGPDADIDGTTDNCDTCTDTDNDGYGDPGFAQNTCPPDGCPSDPLKSSAGACGCSFPEEFHPFDIAENCFVDLPDAALLVDCLLGPGGGASSECADFDWSNDDDVGLDDFAEFQRVFGRHGP